ncbi:MAG: UDP-glucose--hexose-1-phosphate uridylyltransferase [Burkholderiales bacterium]|nr:UDP-glucose--hexose-1-phosphate uridylyltransferase [Burkholderiales bacterium]
MKHNKLANLVELLLINSEKLHLTKSRDRIYFRNRLFILLGIQLNEYQYDLVSNLHIFEILEEIYDSLSESQQEIIAATKEQAITRIIDQILPPPSIVECTFKTIKTNKSLKAATDWYYQFSKLTDYIKVNAIAKNKKWVSSTAYGTLEITINLSKPEKDPKEIAKAKTLTNSSYPKCLLCIENEGYEGNGNNHPARHNHRMLKIPLANKEYYFQYSPYLYYPEHSIIINPIHCDMVVNSEMINNFFAFVDYIPHYIIGSNTDIPIVGGSILTHDHYQAGNHIFPIEKAKSKFTVSSDKYPNIQISYLYWPLSTIKLIGNKADLLNAFELVKKHWYEYTNIDLDIIAYSSNNERHNAITPILRKIDENRYTLYLMLRNNRTTEQYPDGIFHPHADLHHIKKENIGLIEAMGLAILPGRLDSELAIISNILLHNKIERPDNIIKHQSWINELKDKYLTFDNININQILQDEVSLKFAKVLDDSGVFKQDSIGDSEAHKLINYIFN